MDIVNFCIFENLFNLECKGLEFILLNIINLVIVCIILEKYLIFLGLVILFVK